MSRVAKSPIVLPAGVTASLEGDTVTIKGPKSTLSTKLPPGVQIEQQDNRIVIAADSIAKVKAMAGTARAVLNSMVLGVSKGYEKKLTLIGVGYRAQIQGTKLNLQLGFSHPIEFTAPAGITIESPSQTEIIVKGADKHMVGQVAANIRAFRKPEPYKGKGVRYSTEKVVIKEAKKK